MPRKPKQETHKGVYEKNKGSGIWWIRYVNSEGKRIAESVGLFGDAVRRYNDCKQAVRDGATTQPLRHRGTLFSQLVEDALK